MSRKGHGGLYKAPTKEERRKRTAKRRERDQIKFIGLRFERWQVVGSRKGIRMESYILSIPEQCIQTKIDVLVQHSVPSKVSKKLKSLSESY